MNGPLPKLSLRNPYVLVHTDRFAKVTRWLPSLNREAFTPCTSSLTIGSSGVVNRRILLTDNGSQIVSKFFTAMLRYLLVRHWTKTAHHPQINGQVEQSNKMIVAWLRNYGAKNQTCWDQFAQPWTYAYKAQTHCQKEPKQFGFMLFCHPTDPAVLDSPSSIPTNIPTLPEPCSFCKRFCKNCTRSQHVATER